jgi:uracil-DNA glycosylase
LPARELQRAAIMDHALPDDWQQVLGAEFDKPYWKLLSDFVDAERATQTIFPPEEEVLSAFRLTPFNDVRVFIMGQDPYHGPGQAHGLAFSVKPGVSHPPSLANIFREARDDVGTTIPRKNGYLVPWAEQGVMLLNAVLTVRAHTPNSHKGKGWEKFTDAAIKALGERDEPLIFVLWGAYAQKKIKLIDTAKHTVLHRCIRRRCRRTRASSAPSRSRRSTPSSNRAARRPSTGRFQALDFQDKRAPQVLEVLAALSFVAA